MLENDDPFKCFSPFFQDFADDTEKGDEQTGIQFTKLHHGNEKLPSYSDHEQEMIKFDKFKYM